MTSPLKKLEALKRTAKHFSTSCIEGETHELTEEQVAEICSSFDEEKEMQKKLLYCVERNPQTGEIRITPMNGKGYISIHGEEETVQLICCLLDQFQKL